MEMSTMARAKRHLQPLLQHAPISWNTEIKVPSSEILLEALGNISQGVLVAGADQKIIYCNNSYTQITGFTKGDVSGRVCDFTHGPETSADTLAEIKTALRAAQVFSGEILNYKKSGEAFWNDLTILPIPDSKGEIVNFIGIIRDISAKKQFEADIIAKEERHRFLLDRIQAGIVIHGANTEVLYANARALVLLNMEQKDIQGVVNTDPRWIFVREDGSPMPVAEFPVNQAIETLSTVRNFVMGKRHCDSHDVTWLMCNAYPVLDITGKVKEIVVSFTDVTDLKQTERALQKSDERLRLIIQGSNDAPWDWDKANNKMYYSQKWWDMIGYEPDELPAGGELWVKLLHHQDRKRVSRQFTHFLNEVATSYEIEFRLRHKKGHFVPVLSRGIILRDDAGIPIRMNTLRARGIRFSLDDFGTGYSSLSYLQRMPLDELKIDKTFVRDASSKSKDSAIARIIITLAENLGLNVIAEGVETEAQRLFLSDNGCHAYQGYLFGRPMSIDAFEVLLLAHFQSASQNWENFAVAS
eukprot:gene7690-7751_t